MSFVTKSNPRRLKNTVLALIETMMSNAVIDRDNECLHEVKLSLEYLLKKHEMSLYEGKLDERVTRYTAGIKYPHNRYSQYLTEMDMQLYSLLSSGCEYAFQVWIIQEYIGTVKLALYACEIYSGLIKPAR